MAPTTRTEDCFTMIQSSAQPYWAGSWVEKFDNSSLRQLYRRTFAGLSVVFVDLQCDGPTNQDIRVDCGRLCVTLDERGGQMEGRVSQSRRAPSRLQTMYPMSLTPAGMPFWAYSDTTRYVTFALFLFDYATVVPLIGEDVDVRPLAEPRVMFFDERVLMLARLLALECNDATNTDILYGDSLSVALLLRLCRLEKFEHPPQRTFIAPHRLQLAQDFMLTDLSAHVRLEDVASLIGLSPAHFSRAFKLSTGLSPHQWRLKERLKYARRMMATSPHTIAQIAASTGFSDQAHFTRVFRRLYGVTPAAWKREAR